MSGAFTAAFTELAPEFERTTGTKIVTRYGGSMGNSPIRFRIGWRAARRRTS
jgi:molybdate transport system substrate-binding protein